MRWVILVFLVLLLVCTLLLRIRLATPTSSGETYAGHPTFFAMSVIEIEIALLAHYGFNASIEAMFWIALPIIWMAMLGVGSLVRTKDHMPIREASIGTTWVGGAMLIVLGTTGAIALQYVQPNPPPAVQTVQTLPPSLVFGQDVPCGPAAPMGPTGPFIVQNPLVEVDCDQPVPSPPVYPNQPLLATNR